MLTQDERDRLARWARLDWVGVHLVRRDKEGDVTAIVAHRRTWLNPPTGNDMLMLLDNLDKEGWQWVLGPSLDIDGMGHAKSLGIWKNMDDETAVFNRSDNTAQLAVCRAILAMLEDSND